MNGTQAKQLVIKHFDKNFNNLGFQLKKTRDTNIIYIRNKESGFDRFGLGFNLYYPRVNFGFATSKRIDQIENQIKNINKNLVKLTDNKFTSEEIEKNQSVSSYISHTRKEITDLKILYAESEEELILEFNKILDFFINKTIPILDSFNDIREIDTLINGEGENFWDNDSSPDRPFTLAHLFYPRRLIIARLCKNELAFNAFIEKFYEMIDEKLKNNNKPILNRTDFSISTNFIIKYLKENVQSIY